MTISYIDIEEPENRDWWEKYKYDIPVFHLNGEFLMKHHVDKNVVEAKLKQYELMKD